MDVKPLYFGKLRLASRYALAPLAGYTNLAFRMAVRSCGGLGVATTDLINSRALLRGSVKTLDLAATCPEDRPLAVQIYGADSGELVAAAQWLEGYGVSAVDINMGCPVNKVVKGGGGSAMMCSPESTVNLVKRVVDAVRIPVTVKMRLGWDDKNLTAPYFAQSFEDVGTAAVTIHGRTRAQGFKGQVNREGIRKVVEAVKSMPVMGNGDIRNLAEAKQMFDETGCAGITIGRGALLNPWFFHQLVEEERTGQVPEPPSYEDRVKFMEAHFKSNVTLRGEWFGCLTFRKVATWYCKVLKPGHSVQQELVMVKNSTHFSDIMVRLRENLTRFGVPQGYTGEAAISVPSGPNERW